MKQQPLQNNSEKNFKDTVLLLKLAILVGICRRNRWRYDYIDLKYRVNRYGSEAAISYVQKDQKIYHRIVHAMANLISKRD